MRYERCHVFHLGAGGSYKKGRGIGCNCDVNILMLDRYLHDVLDGRTINYELRHYKHAHREELEKEPRAYRHKIAFGAIFTFEDAIDQALRHHEDRNRGLAKCCKKR